MVWRIDQEGQRRAMVGERERRIRDSRYNRWYKIIKEKGISEYLKKGWGRAGGGGC